MKSTYKVIRCPYCGVVVTKIRKSCSEDRMYVGGNNYNWRRGLVCCSESKDVVALH